MARMPESKTDLFPSDVLGQTRRAVVFQLVKKDVESYCQVMEVKCVSTTARMLVLVCLMAGVQPDFTRAMTQKIMLWISTQCDANDGTVAAVIFRKWQLHETADLF